MIPSGTIVKNNYRIFEVLFALECLSFVTVLSLKGVSKGEKR